MSWLSKRIFFTKLTKRHKKARGRSWGKITVRRRGGGLRLKAVVVDYNRFLWNTPAYVKSIEKSKNHSCYLALIVYSIGVISYIIAPEKLRLGSFIISSVSSPNLPGCCSLLKYLPFNTKIHNIESYPGSGGKFIRSAGSWAKILEKNNDNALLVFNNGKKRYFSLKCSATVGAVSNSNHKNSSYLMKAGDSRQLGRRPSVRGVAMNPVDHPHGGGEGKKSPPSSNYNFVRKLPKGRKTVKS